MTFLAALIISGVTLDRWLPYPDSPSTGDKIHYLAIHGDEYDTIFMGSSRVNFQIMPSLFDQTLAGRGSASKSFNAGILGMRPPEQCYFLEQVLRRPHRRLRWVIIELTSLEARVPPSRRDSARFMFWHDGPRLKLLGIWTMAEWTTLLGQEPGEGAGRARWSEFWEPLSVFLMHLPPFFERTLNLGRASFVRDRLLVTPSERAKVQVDWPLTLGKDRDGWTPYLLRETMIEKEREDYLQSYEARLRSPAVQFHDPASDAAVKAMFNAVVRAGATPIFIVPPMTADRQYFPPPALAGSMTIWSFSDPRGYPALYAAENHVDPSHLNTVGAEQFTVALAERFMELSKQ